MSINRRQFLQSASASGLALGLSGKLNLANAETRLIKKTIPATGEQLSTVGVGTSRTFSHKVPKSQLLEVLQLFFDHQGQLIDSSPMYGPAEELIGLLLPDINNKKQLFAATKVWTDGQQQGVEQMQRSLKLMNVARIDLMQIHNLRDWKLHLQTLRAWKAEGLIRYIGITTSHGRFHQELEDIIKTEPLDFIQLSYSMRERENEKYLLPMAGDKGIATLINRPYQRGRLFRQVKGKNLPEWASEIDCHSWGQFFLKFVISHPATTCVIPATSKPKHMLDNMQAGRGRLPDANMRKEMLHYLAKV